MQKAIEAGQVQLGAALAEKLGVQRDEHPEIQVAGKPVVVSRVNRATGTWQDSAALLDLADAQAMFELPNRLSRIEAIECTSEQCAQTGLKSEIVLANELARMTDRAAIFRRDQIAEARSGIRVISRANLRLLQNVLWILLAAAIIGLSSLNAYQRKSEVGVLQALGYGVGPVVMLFVLRTMLLAMAGAAIGVGVGAVVAQSQGQSLFAVTGSKLNIDWQSAITIGLVATLLSGLSSGIPAVFAAMRHPAELIGKES